MQNPYSKGSADSPVQAESQPAYPMGPERLAGPINKRLNMMEKELEMKIEQVQIRRLLEETCPVCHGQGWVTGNEFKPTTPKDPEGRRCTNCINGKAPTEIGEAVLEFVRDHLEFWVLEQSKNHTHGRGE